MNTKMYIRHAQRVGLHLQGRSAAVNGRILHTTLGNGNTTRRWRTAAQAAQKELSPFPSGPIAVIFDLDGTLTETELLKARSYARAACEVYGVPFDSAELTNSALSHREVVASVMASIDFEYDKLTTDDIQNGYQGLRVKPRGGEDGGYSASQITDICIQAYMDNIGGTTESVARQIVNTLELQDRLAADMVRLQVDEPWQALYRLHKEGWPRFCTKENVWEARYEHNLELLRRAHAAGLPLGLATSSLTSDAHMVLDFLGVRQLLHVVKGKDTVKKPKPDPEVYRLVASLLGVDPRGAVAVEDSLAGATAAKRAGLTVIAVGNEFTRPLWQRQEDVLPKDQIVTDLSKLESTLQLVCQRAAEKAAALI